MYNNAIYVTSKDKMPTVPHWAIVGYKTIREEVGQNEWYDQQVVEYQAYLSEEDWKKEITERMKRPCNCGAAHQFSAFAVNPAAIETTFSVTVKV
jgi:hypothetical protein